MKAHTRRELSALDAEAQAREEIEKAIENITDTLNWGNGDEVAKIILEQLRRTHRTLQEDFWRMLVQVVKGYAEADHDARNQAAVELCKKWSSLSEVDLYLPRI